MKKPEAIILTETWLTERDPLAKLDFKGYQPRESNPASCMKRRSIVLHSILRTAKIVTQLKLNQTLSVQISEFFLTTKH